MRENEFQSKLIKKLKTKFPNCVVMKNDANYRQGFPDISVHCNGSTAFLECKRNKSAPHQPNQDYWIGYLKEQGFYSSFIYPENEKEVLDDLERSFT
jgi:hypothetical protein